MTIEYSNDCNAMESSVGASGDSACQNDDEGTGDGVAGSVCAPKTGGNCLMSTQSDVLVQLVAQMESMKAELTNELGQESWTVRQNLQDMYTKIILCDLEYALDKKIEQDLWNTVFKQPITTLQMRLSDKKNPKRAEVQMNLSNLLEHSSGFYLQLLQEICSTFVIDLPCRMYLPNNTVLQTNTNSIVRKNMDRSQPKRGSCACICQHCLVHLGDLARYRQQAEQARTYYHWAMVVVPTSGHPYNQLAILENQKGNLLSTIFYYALAMACKTPFPAATTNFEKLLARIRKDQLPSTARLGQQELTTCFLHYHGAIHLSQGATDISRGRVAWERFSRQFASQLSPVCHFDWKELVQMSAIQLFALSGAGGTRDAALSETVESLVTSLVSLIECFSHCLIQLQEDKLPRSPIFPALALLCCWLGSNWTSLKGQSTSSALMTVSSMPNFVRLLNSLQKMEAAALETTITLPEDNMLQGFQPVANIVSCGSTSDSGSDSPDESKLPFGETGDVDDKVVFRQRLLRLMDAAQSLVRHKVICYQQNQFSLLPQTSLSPGLNLTRSNGPVAPLAAVNVAMQSIIQQKQQEQMQKCHSPPAKQSQPGLLISAEIARSIQEHIAQVSKTEVPVRPGPVSASPVTAPAGTPVGATAASERRYLYNQNREQFQKDLPPRFARKAAAAAMAGGGGLMSNDSALLGSEPANVSRCAVQQPNSLPLARKESEPLYPTMWFGAQFYMQSGQEESQPESGFPQFGMFGGLPSHSHSPPHSGPSLNPGWLPDGSKMPPSLMSGTSRPLPPPVGTRMPGPRPSLPPQQHQRHNLPVQCPPNTGITGNGGGDSVDPVSRRLLSGNVQSLWASPLENLLQQQQRQGGIGTGTTNAPATQQLRFGAPPQQSRSGAT